MRVLRVVPFLLLTAPAAAQIAPGHAVVASHRTGPTRTEFYDVDLTTRRFARVANLSIPRAGPTAIVMDRVSGDFFVATDHGAAASIYRVEVEGAGATVLRLGGVAGRIRGLALGLAGDLFFVTEGGSGRLWRLARSGGTPRSLASVPRATAIFGYGLHSTHVWVAQSGSGGTTPVDPQLVQVDLASGRITAGPYRYRGYTPRGITGVLDLPTGLVRHVLSHDDGTVALSVSFQKPKRVPVTPALPSGAARDIRSLPDGRVLVLGGKAHPYLATFQPLRGAQTWQRVAGPLPGDPVAFDVWPALQAQALLYGTSCRGPAPSAPSLGFSGGAPRLGNAAFTVRMSGGAGRKPAFLVAGFEDFRWQVFWLPLRLPGGCLLRNSPDLVLGHLTDALGNARQRMGVPATRGLAGARLFVQWLQPTANLFSATAGGACLLAQR